MERFFGPDFDAELFDRRFPPNTTGDPRIVTLQINLTRLIMRALIQQHIDEYERGSLVPENIEALQQNNGGPGDGDGDGDDDDDEEVSLSPSQVHRDDEGLELAISEALRGNLTRLEAFSSHNHEIWEFDGTHDDGDDEENGDLEDSSYTSTPMDLEQLLRFGLSGILDEPSTDDEESASRDGSLVSSHYLFQNDSEQ